jgi:hypothetical protein
LPGNEGIEEKMNCRWCGSRRVRISRLHLADLFTLFGLRYPIRCHTCYERYSLGLLQAWALHRAGREQRSQLKPEFRTVRPNFAAHEEPAPAETSAV